MQPQNIHDECDGDECNGDECNDGDKCNDEKQS